MLFTLLIQIVVMRRFEKMLGWLRIVIIYTVCGMAANVFSAIFLPYFVTVRIALSANRILTWGGATRPTQKFCRVGHSAIAPTHKSCSSTF